MDKDIIIKAYEYYDKQQTNYKKYINNMKKMKEIKKDNDTDKSIIEMYDNNDKLILKASYQYLGEYDKEVNIWKWGWSIDVKKNMNYFIKKIFDYGFNITTDQKKNKIAYMIKILLTNSIIKIKNKIFLLALSLYLTKGTFIFNHKKDTQNKRTDYFLLNDVEIL